MDLSAGRISDFYVPFVLNGLLGILHNRFSYLWNPALECLAVLISQHFALVWDNFVYYIEQCQLISQTSSAVDHCVNAVAPDRLPNGIAQLDQYIWMLYLYIEVCLAHRCMCKKRQISKK